ncbi:hypothetical protein EJB05_25260, partial [Eragrostis curvula]
MGLLTLIFVHGQFCCLPTRRHLPDCISERCSLLSIGMEEHSNRMPKTDIGFQRRGSRISLRNQNPGDRTNPSSDRPGSSTRLNPMRTRMADNEERSRYLCDSFESSSSKMTPANSSKFPLRKFREEKRRQSFLAGVDIADSSTRKAEVKPLEGRKQIAVEYESDPECIISGQGQSLPPDPEGSHFTNSSGMSSHRVDSFVRSSRIQRQNEKEVNLGTPGTCSSSFPNRPTKPGNSATGVRPSYGYVGGVQRRCVKTPSLLDLNRSRRFEDMGKRDSDGGSSSRPRSLSGPVSLGHLSPAYLHNTGPRIRTTEQPLPHQLIQRSSRNNQDSAVSVRTRRSSTQERGDHWLSLHEPSTRNQQPDQSHLPFHEVSSERSIRPFQVELPHEIYSSSHRGLIAQTAGRRPSPLERSPPQLFPGLLGERDNLGHINVNGVAEQLRVLMANLSNVRAFASHDEHREMRMNIDSMSYEDLLALEERIGSVSTALSEEQYTKCLRRSSYIPVAAEVKKSVADDIKCSICQVYMCLRRSTWRVKKLAVYHVSTSTMCVVSTHGSGRRTGAQFAKLRQFLRQANPRMFVYLLCRCCEHVNHTSDWVHRRCPECSNFL